MTLAQDLPLRFIHDRLTDLLDERTSEENRARIHISWSLLLELADACAHDAHPKGKGKKERVRTILEETERALQRDRNLKLPRPLAEQWNTFAELKRSVKDDAFVTAERLATSVGERLRQVSTQEIRERVRLELDEKKPKYCVLDQLCEYWVTNVLWHGHSVPYLRKRCTDVSPGQVLELFEELPEEEKRYFVVAGVRGAQSAPSDVAVPAVVQTHIQMHFTGTDSTSWIAVRVDAVDPEAAALLGRKRINEIVSVGQFISPRTSISVIDPLYVSSDDASLLVTEHKTSLEKGYPHRSKGPGIDTNQWSRILRHESDRGDPLLSVALRHHWLSCNAETIDARVINLWTAFEALLADGSQATSVAVSSKASAMLAGRYVHYSVRRLAMDLLYGSPRRSQQRANIIKALKSIPDDFQASPASKKPIDPRALDITFASPKDGVLIDALYDAVTSRQLLAEKVTRLRLHFKSRAQLKTRLDHHRDTIQWQLHRIYRTRNAIVHGRKSPPFSVLTPLVRHAQHYLEVVLNQVIHDMSADALVSASEAVKRSVFAFQSLTKALSGKKEGEVGVSYSALTEPAWWIIPRQEESLWSLSTRVDKALRGPSATDANESVLADS